MECPDYRWCKFIIVSVMINLLPWLVIPAVVHGAGFQLSVMLLALAPILWAFTLFFVFRTPRERWVCYASVLAAIPLGFVVFEEIRRFWMWH